MARGWESKSVESQQTEDIKKRSGRHDLLTSDERERLRKKGSLELSRRRVLHDIEETQSAVRRTSLEQALAFLDEEIRKLER
jgi:CHASE3 domain sensor protein